jgi:hypothetical protein
VIANTHRPGHSRTGRNGAGSLRRTVDSEAENSACHESEWWYTTGSRHTRSFSRAVDLDVSEDALRLTAASLFPVA